MPAPKPPPGVLAVDRYLKKVAQPHHDTLVSLRTMLRELLPHAEECIKYGIPAFMLTGKGIAHYAAFKAHCSYFPGSGVLSKAGKAVARYTLTKGTLRFSPDQALPLSLVKRLVKLRLTELSQVKNGKRYQYFDDGRVKAVGGMKAGKLHGHWQWFRNDGTLMRKGQFRAGEQVGTWETWRRDGTLLKTTQKVKTS